MQGLPRALALPVISRLKVHGIAMETLKEAKTVEVDMVRLTGFKTNAPAEGSGNGGNRQQQAPRPRETTSAAPANNAMASLFANAKQLKKR